jgi:flagellar hook-associated protein 1 FlgK
METLVGGIHFSQASLGAQWTQSRESLDVLVADVNASAGTIADLNTAIQRANQSGLPANDLADQRDLLVMKLADQVGATVRHADDGVLDVLVGGMTLVAGSSAGTLATAGTSSVDGVAADPARIVTGAGGYTVRAGGTAEGQLNSLNTIIPNYRKALDDTAVSLATSLNTAHAAGFDLTGAAGTPLLGSASGPITAASLTVMITDPKKIAASSVGPTAGAPALDNGNADAIGQLRLSTTSTDAGYRKMIVELGVQAAVASRNVDIQSVISTQVDAARESVAGVNVDEEMTNMLSFQHAYSAAGRMITAIDQTLDTLINRTGLVGR